MAASGRSTTRKAAATSLHEWQGVRMGSFADNIRPYVDAELRSRARGQYRRRKREPDTADADRSGARENHRKSAYRRAALTALPAVAQLAQLHEHGARIGVLPDFGKLTAQRRDDLRVLQPQERVHTFLLAERRH